MLTKVGQSPSSNSLGSAEEGTAVKVEVKVTDQERTRLERVGARPPLSEIRNLPMLDFEVRIGPRGPTCSLPSNCISKAIAILTTKSGASCTRPSTSNSPRASFTNYEDTSTKTEPQRRVLCNAPKSGASVRFLSRWASVRKLVHLFKPAKDCSSFTSLTWSVWSLFVAPTVL